MKIQTKNLRDLFDQDSSSSAQVHWRLSCRFAAKHLVETLHSGESQIEILDELPNECSSIYLFSVRKQAKSDSNASLEAYSMKMST